MPVAPMGFYLQRFPLCGSERRLPATLVLHVVHDPSHPANRTRGSRDFEDLRIRGVRCTAPVLPGEQCPIRSWLSPLRGFHLVGLGCGSDPTTSSLGLRHDARWPKPPIVMPALQSFREPAR
jgi:hypothetical protein